MKMILIFSVFSLHNYFLYAQGDINNLKFVGYKASDPVFWLNAGDVENESSSNFDLVRLIESKGKLEILPISEGVKEVLSYSNDKFVCISEYDRLEIVVDDDFIDIQFQEDYFDETDFRIKVFEFAERLNMSSITFSPNSEKLTYPVYSRLKMRSYIFRTGLFENKDFTDINEYGGALLMPTEMERHIYFLASRRGSYEVCQFNKQSMEFKKAPFTFRSKGDFGFKYHPLKEEMLFVYRNMPFAYSFNQNKFKKLDFPKRLITTDTKLASCFERIYYSYKLGDWRYIVHEKDELIAYSLKISGISFDLDWSEVEELIEEERLKNLSPKEELREMLKKFAKASRPLSNDQKKQVNESLLKFDKKYYSKLSDSEVKNALITSRVVRLDTALVMEDVVESNKLILVEMIQKNELNFNALLGLQLLGRVSTIQPPVHPARVMVLRELVDDYLSENDLSSYEALEASGLGLLILALKANGHYEEAIKYNQKYLGYIEKHNVSSRKLEVLEGLIYVQIMARHYQDALTSITTYKAALNENSRSYLEKLMKVEINTAHAYAGMDNFNEAFEIIKTQDLLLKESENDIFGEETKKWLRFSLLYAYVEIHFEKKSAERYEHLIQLLTYVSESAASFQYKKMYAETVSLLNKLGESDKVDRLSPP